MVKRRIMAGVLASALVVSMATDCTMAGAEEPATTSSATAKIYAPTDFIDVIVPTKFEIAFNPLEVDITSNASDATVPDVNKNNLTGSTQILSGTYAIQNRSTTPVTVAVAFQTTAGGGTIVTDADGVSAEDALGDQATTPKYSLSILTTAKGTAQALSTTVETSKTDGANGRGLDAASGVKIAKTSSSEIALTTAADTETANTAEANVNFMLAAGPYTAEYDATENTVEYKENAKGTYDAVGFKFTGTTTTNTKLWTEGTPGESKVVATYTIAGSTTTGYESAAFDPYSKAVTLTKGSAGVNSTSNGEYSYTANDTVKGLTLTADKTATDSAAGSNKVTILDLTGGKNKAVSSTMEKAGMSATKNDSGLFDKVTVNTASTEEKATYEWKAEKIYQVTVGGESFILYVDKVKE